MYCRFCGQKIPNDSHFCTFCGENLKVQDNKATDINENAEDEYALEEPPVIEEEPSTTGKEPMMIVEESPTTAIFLEELPSTIKQIIPEERETLNKKEEPIAHTTTDTGLSETAPGFGWYNFVVKVQLWLSMLVSLTNGTRFIRGGNFDDPSVVYNLFPGIKPLDIVFGIFSFGLVVFTFYTRTLLKRFDAKGPKYYIAIIIINAFEPCLYNIACSAITKIPFGQITDTGPLFIRMGLTVLLAAFNIYYFNKRKNYFSDITSKSIQRRFF